MTRWNISWAALAVLGLGGCFRGLGAEALDASTDPTEVERDASGPSAEPQDAGLLPRYHWLANGPTGEREEGPVSFVLRCADGDGKPADCRFRCALDGAPYEPCSGDYARDWVGVNLLGDALRHEFCVDVAPSNPPDGSLAEGSVVCRDWLATPFAQPFVWVEEAISSQSTELRFAPCCAQRLSNGTLGAPTEDCTFRFSLDGQPYEDIPNHEDGGVGFRNLRPGQHVLRAEVTGPLGFEHVWHVSAVTWTIAETALPAVVYEPLTPPGPLSRAELDALGLGRLIEPYAEFARACMGEGETSVYAEQLIAFLGYGFGQPHVTGGENRVASESSITDCENALRERPASCRSLPGLPADYYEEGPLAVRLPEGCTNLTRGGVRSGNVCLTSIDCQGGVCEYPERWLDRPLRGFCASSPEEVREDILCRSRGCAEGLYCASVCRRVLAPLAACNPGLLGRDCPATYTCAGSEEPRCLPASAGLGDACRFTRDCTEGWCSERTCVP